MKSGNHYLMLLKNEGLDDDLVVGFLSDFFESNVENSKKYIIVKALNHTKEDIQAAIESLMFDLSNSFKALYTETITDNELYDYIEMIEKYFNKDLKNNFYDEASLVEESLTPKKDDALKAFVLKEYLFDYEMQETVKEFLLNDMNVLQTSKKLYMHRNTLLNRLDRFTENTGFDPRKFKDAYILYAVLK